MADNIFITAFIGGGKSLLGVHMVCNELNNSERAISTSLPFFLDDHWHRVPLVSRHKLPPGLPSWWLPEARTRAVEGSKTEMEVWAPGLATWCHYEIEKPVNLNERLRILKHEEVPRFYLHLPNRDLPEVEHRLPGRKPITLPDLTQRKDGGCLFVVDEIHIYFSSRNYLESGPGVEMYQSQLRHLNDDMVMISQHLEKVDKNFRRNCTKTYELSNMGHRPLWGGVTLKERFNWRLYTGVPQRGDRPVDKGSFQLRDRGMCWLYDTMAGVGVTGGIVADKPPKGRHWVTWVVIGLAIIAAAVVLPRMGMKAFGYGVGTLVHSVEGGVRAGTSKGITTLEGRAGAKPATGNRDDAVSRVASDSPIVTVTPVQAAPLTAPITCTGTCGSGVEAIAFLSNGEVLRASDGTLLLVRPRFVVDVTKHVYAILPAPHIEPVYSATPGAAWPGDWYVRKGGLSVSVVGQSYRAKGLPELNPVGGGIQTSAASFGQPISNPSAFSGAGNGQFVQQGQINAF